MVPQVAELQELKATKADNVTGSKAKEKQVQVRLNLLHKGEPTEKGICRTCKPEYSSYVARLIPRARKLRKQRLLRQPTGRGASFFRA